ncbi:NAD(P)/FAD-dependent oxidoreductase [soil metagenome]
MIVGAGPAGLAAAAAATAEGLEVTVVDERLAAGGSVDGALGASARDPDAAWLMPPLGARDAANGRIERLRERATAATVLTDALVWGLFPGWTLAVTRGGRTRRIDAAQVILATGSYVARPPFLGHALTGVLTPLGLARALEEGHIAAGARVAVLGDDAFADEIAETLTERGAAPVALLAERPRPSPHPVLVLAAPSVARGGERLETLDLELVGGERATLDVEWLVIAGPRSVASELAHMAGCDHRFDGYEAGFRPVRGRDGATSVAGIFVAGSLAGAQGYDASECSGAVAGLAAAVRAGRAPAERLEALLADATPTSAPPPARIPPAYRAVDAASTDVACHCIGTTFADVAAVVKGGARSIDDVKRQAKAGMGPCQGRDCHRTVVRLLATVGDVDIATLRPMRARPPVRPVTARAMFEEQDIEKHAVST